MRISDWSSDVCSSDLVFDGIWQLDEADEAAKYEAEPGHVKVKDLNNDGKINADDQQIIGNPLPKWIGGMTNTFNYKGVDFSLDRKSVVEGKSVAVSVGQGGRRKFKKNTKKKQR